EGEDGSHDESQRVDPIADAEAVKQLVDLGYIDAPPDDARQAVRECTRELQFNLARAYMDGARFGAAAPILEELWNSWPAEHRFGGALIRCLGAMGELDRRAEAIDLFEARTREHAEKARAELERLKPEIDRLLATDADPQNDADALSDPDEDAMAAPAAERDAERFRLRHTVRRLSSLAAPREAHIAWLRLSHSIETGKTEDARRTLDGFSMTGAAHPSLCLSFGAAELRVGRHDRAMTWFHRALEADNENAEARLGLAECAIARRDWAVAIDESLTAIDLSFHLPRAHTLLGRAVWRSGDAAAAERALRVALAQAPGYAPAARTLAAILSRDPDRQDEARKLRARLRGSQQDRVWSRGRERLEYRATTTAEGSDPGDPTGAIVIVSGLPRSGTSMMMQMLAAGGLELVIDDHRSADESNPHGYYEDRRVARLGRDAGWLHEARGKAVKIVAPLIPLIPRTTPAFVIFMDRPMDAVLRSQRAMLERLGRAGSGADHERLATTLSAQARRAKAWAATAPHAASISVDYDDAIADPSDAARRVAAFLRRDLDTPAMAAAVDPSLRRQSA
ncbi:MAG: hypothetical protein D6693_01945, partial [Planctomycetota bacterium]